MSKLTTKTSQNPADATPESSFELSSCKVCNMPVGKCRARWKGDELPHVHGLDARPINLVRELEMIWDMVKTYALPNDENLAAFQALRTALAGLGNINWQPINTAPKDGTFILLLGDSGYTTTPYRVAVGYWYDYWLTHSNDAFTNDGEPPIAWAKWNPSAMKGINDDVQHQLPVADCRNTNRREHRECR